MKCLSRLLNLQFYRVRATYPKLTNRTAKMEKSSPRRNLSPWSSSMRTTMPSSLWATKSQRNRETETLSSTSQKVTKFLIQPSIRRTLKRSLINSRTKNRPPTRMISTALPLNTQRSIRRPLRKVNKSRRISTQHKLRIGIKLRSVVKFLCRKMTQMKNKSMELLTLSTNKQSINLTACSPSSPLL